MATHYVYLILAILFETIGTASLQASQQFTKLVPSALVIIGYALAFWMLGLTLKYMPVGVVYALWSGMGIILITLIGMIVFGQRLDLPAVIGIALILIGVVIIHAFSKTATH